jgi:Protein of unknown function (DUF3037)
MADFKQCDFFLLRYVPDVVKGEFVNVGVVLLENGEGGFTDVRFTRDWRRARCLDPEVDIALMESYEAELRRLLQSRAPEIINYRGPMSRREWLLALMQESFSGALELAPMSAVLTESPAAELGKLAQAYLEAERRAAQREAAGRRAIYNAMRDAFVNAGIWELPQMRKEIAAAQYTPGDPLKIDCGYRANGVVHMFHAVSLATDVNAAKVLAFSYPTMRDGIMTGEGAMSDMTAVTEDGLDLADEAVAFALATLQGSDIAVARVGQMPQIAERARVELRL